MRKKVISGEQVNKAAVMNVPMISIVYLMGVILHQNLCLSGYTLSHTMSVPKHLSVNTVEGS